VKFAGRASLICTVNLSQTALAGFYDVPEAIEPAIMYVNGRYKDTPVYITENGELQLCMINGPESFPCMHDQWSYVLRYILGFRFLTME
jgi:beta-glucosidase/6-phospho-beta-glucosidase/beta-galactosidase